MEYFGTNLTEHGHYHWNIDNGFQKMNYRFEELPFNPENLTNNLPKGRVIFYQGGGFTLIGIAGSCKDERGGTTSIFWINEIITKEEMIERVKANPLAMEIINKMPFTVKW
jgi:hypothetical protein